MHALNDTITAIKAHVTAPSSHRKQMEVTYFQFLKQTDRIRQRKKKGQTQNDGGEKSVENQKPKMKLLRWWLRRRDVFLGGEKKYKTYLALAIVPPRPLVTQTNKTARTYHGGAVSDLGLDTTVFFELDQVVEGVPWPCAAEEEILISFF